MKLLPILLLMLTSSICFAQNKTSDVFASARMTWFGLDFTKVKIPNGVGFPIIEDVKTRFVPSWNHLFIEEADKYDLAKTYSKSLVSKDLKTVNELNKTINVDEIVTYEESSPITKDDVGEMIKKYETNVEEGIGLVYIVESLDKVAELATVHVTFFDIKNREVIFHQRMQSNPRGFGVRNYWAGAFFKIMERCKKDWKKWAKSTRD